MTASRILSLSALLLIAQQAGASCGTAYCSVNTAWEALGAAPKPGWTLDLRYEYLRQDTLRAGSSETAAAGIADTHDEVSTLNRNVNASLDYAWSTRWGVSLQMPYVQREHDHIHNDPIEDRSLKRGTSARSAMRACSACINLHLPHNRARLRACALA